MRLLGVLGLLGSVLVLGPSAGPAPAPWITVCGTLLCDGGRVWRLQMGTIYNGLDDPQAAVARVAALGLNTVRVTDFLDVDGAPRSAPYDAASWARVDRLIAAAAARGLHVELDLSAYRNLLKRSGLDPYAYDWKPFLRWVLDRRNTVTGTRYGDDPTIALVSFAGEVDAVNGSENTYGLTTGGLTAFYRRVEAVWRGGAPRQLLTAGGLAQLYPGSGIDWRAIFALPDNDVDAIHVYSRADLTQALPAVAAESRRLGRPWITEEFGFPAALGDRKRAASYSGVLAANQRAGSAGVGLWNVGPQTDDTYDVGPQFPLTSGVVERWSTADDRPG